MNYSVKLIKFIDDEFAVILSETLNRKKTTIKIKIGKNGKDNYDYFKRILDKKDFYSIISFISFYKGIDNAVEILK